VYLLHLFMAVTHLWIYDAHARELLPLRLDLYDTLLLCGNSGTFFSLYALYISGSTSRIHLGVDNEGS